MRFNIFVMHTALHTNARTRIHHHTTAPRTIYTRRALDSTKLLGDALFGTRTIAIEQMSINTAWVTGLAVIIISSIVGACLLLSFMRSYQESAKSPRTKCGE